MLMTLVMVGCKSVAHETGSPAGPASLAYAQKLFDAGDLYLAKRQTDAFLKANPSSTEGQVLMAEILDEEISQHKEAFEQLSDEELSADNKEFQIKTWLERSRSLFEIGQYDEATNAAETVFTLDPQNAEASKLLDQIKNGAWSAGKKEIMDGSEVVKAEVDDRAVIYRKQAKNYLATGQLGAAKLTAEKLLILHPEDEDGLKILDQVNSKQKHAAKATRS